MADPATLAAVSLGTTAAGGGVSALGSIMSGNSNAAMYSYQAGVARANALIAKQDANYAIESGGVQSQQSGMRTRAEIGATRAGFGASNISGASQNRVVSSEIQVGQQNEGIITANAAKRAYGFNVSAAQDTAQAGAYDEAAATSKTSGLVGAIGTILGTTGNVAAKWSQYAQSFGSPGGQLQVGPMGEPQYS